MAQFKNSIFVNAMPEKAFAYLADITKHTEWASHLANAEKTSEGEIVVGSTFATVGKQFGTHNAEVKLTELEPGKKIVFESQDDSGHFRHFFLLEGGEGGTQITKGFEPLRIQGPLKLFSPLLGLIAPRGLSADLNKIKQHLEA